METKHQDDILALIAKSLAGSATAIEVAQLKEWIEMSAENRQYFEQVKNIWDISDKQIDPKNINIKEAFEKVLFRIPKVFPVKTFWYYWQKVAAIALIPLVIGTFLWVYLNTTKLNSSNENIYNEVYTAFGTRSSLRLADSSLVWLNSGSSLRYPIKFNNNKRQVFLQGEAYFEVKSDISRPFIVQTPTLQVKATGTKFNVQEYVSNPITEVTLVSGKVFVNESDIEKNSTLFLELHPDQHLIYNKQNKTKTIINVDSYRFIAWKDGKLMFRNEPLSKVLNKLGIIFNVDFELQGEELQNYSYRATFQDESLEEILKLLKLSAPIDYTEVKRILLPDRSFAKKKVIIFPKKHTTNN
jgi:transmembrane sensor